MAIFKLHKLDVDCVAPHPTWKHYQATLEESDERLFWLPRSMKRGEQWKALDGEWCDPAEYIAGRTDPDLPALAVGRTFLLVPRSEVAKTWPPPAQEWPSRQIAEALKSAGILTGPVYPAFRRVTTLKSASKSSSDERPSIDEHVQSMSLKLALPTDTPITLIDDSLTRGSQLAACASMLWDEGFTDVRGLCAVHVLKSSDDAREWNVRRQVRWHSKWPHPTVHPREGDRVAQLVIAPVARVELVEVEALAETGRGARGFGSSGR